MKKTLTIFIIILLAATCSTLSAETESKKKISLFVEASGRLLMPSDSRFKDTYGSSHFYPEVKAGVEIFKSVYIWAGYGFLSKSAQLIIYDVITEDISAKQNFLLFGLGYKARISEKMDFTLEAGGASIGFEETAMDTTISETTFGFVVDGGLNINFGKSFYIKVSAKYISGSKTIGDYSTKLGGLSSGVGVGIRF
ncbi:MAG: porin family protein [bacterium]|nr:porin family protein [bacterium]